MHTSGNLLNYITDHKAIFRLVDSINYNDLPPKFIKSEVNYDKSPHTLIQTYKMIPIKTTTHVKSYLVYAKTKLLTTKTIKLCKYKYKKSKLITNGILKSITPKIYDIKLLSKQIAITLLCIIIRKLILKHIQIF